MSTVDTPAIADAEAAANKRADLVNGIRELADFLEAHPEIPEPHVFALAWWHGPPRAKTAEGFEAACKVMIPLGATVTRNDERRDPIVTVEHGFGPVKLGVEARASMVCTERTTTRPVTEHVLPEWAQSATEEPHP